MKVHIRIGHSTHQLLAGLFSTLLASLATHNPTVAAIGALVTGLTAHQVHLNGKQIAEAALRAAGQAALVAVTTAAATAPAAK